MGKSIFIRHFIQVDAKEVMERSVVLSINFGAEPALATDLNDYVMDRFVEQLRDDYDIDVEADKFVRNVYAHELKVFAKGVNAALAIPKEGAQIFFDTLAIPKDAPHPGNAHELIDYLMRPDVAAKNAAFVRYGSGVGGAAALQPPEVRDDPGINPPPDVRAKLVPQLAKSPQFTQLLTRSWTRFRTGR